MNTSQCILASLVLAFAMCILAESAARPRYGEDLDNGDCLAHGSRETRLRAASRDRSRHHRQQHVSSDNAIMFNERGSWPSQKNCGKRKFKETHITHGFQAQPKEWPFLVRVIGSKGQIRVDCGGTIIDKKRILTAAHCIKQEYDYNVELNVPTDDFSGSRFPVKSICKARDYTEGAMEHDWAVLNLHKSNKIKINDWAQPACMPDKNPVELKPDTICRVVGFGYYDTPNGIQQASLLDPARFLPLKPVPCPAEQARHKTITCFKTATGKGSPCFGDSGGPVLCRSNGRWTVMGIVKGVQDQNCESPVSLYVNVSYIIPSIESQCSDK